MSSLLTGRKPFLLLLALMAVISSFLFRDVTRADDDAGNYQVWAIDQSPTLPSGGGALYVWKGQTLAGRADKAEAEKVDLGQAAIAAGCPVGKFPHMGLANDANGLSIERPTHFVLANFGSGDVQFFDIDSRKMVGCINLVGAGGIGTVSTHASVATPDRRMVLVDDIGGQALHKIHTDFATNTYTYVETLNLHTIAAQVGTPFARPVCHGYTADSRYAYVTLQQGGVVVVDLGDPDGSPGMSVVKVYSAATAPGIGCGALLLPNGKMMTNGESGQFGGPDYLYFFDVSGISSGNFPNPVQISLPGEDTHGAFPCVDTKGKVFIWTLMRISGDIVIVDAQTNQVVKQKSVITPFTPAAAPDGIEIRDHTAFVTFRGPKPLTAMSAIQNAARVPGVAALKVSPDCKDFEFREKDFTSLYDPSRMTTIGSGAVVTAADIHGMDVIPAPLHPQGGGGVVKESTVGLKASSLYARALGSGQLAAPQTASLISQGNAIPEFPDAAWSCSWTGTVAEESIVRLPDTNPDPAS